MPKVMIEMEMPYNCACCRFHIWKGNCNHCFCIINDEDITYTYNTNRPKNCPLQEVKE